MRIGSLFTGYGGLDLAVEAVTGAQPAWFAEIDQAPAQVLAHHWPDVPNHGDITNIDWTDAEPVDILTGGFPCQDLSHAGKRLGLRPGTRSGLWDHMAYAINQLQPRMVVIENVRGLLSASAHSNLQRDCWCVGDDREPALRALGAVLGDLAQLGYDARWGGVRASDAGAPHGRFRIFIVAHPAHTDLPGLERRPTQQQRPDQRPTGPGSVEPAPADLGPYAPAVARWETIIGRTAPPPTEPGKDGRPRLNPAFVEHMMGLPAGHVTNPTIGLTRAQQLKALGNGVVPQQAALALRLLLNVADPVTRPTPARSAGGGAPLLPTPAVNDMGEGKTVAIEAQRLGGRP